MPTEVMTYYMNHQDMYLRLGFQMVMQCAPFLKGMKAASLILVREELCGAFETLLGGMNIFWKVLSGNKGKSLVLFYRKDCLESCLKHPGAQTILRKTGYESEKLDEMLDALAERITEQQICSGKFPHEIGLFLGYPPEDVEDFIRKKGKEFLFIGYWKVYHNPSKAKKTFKEFDRAKQDAVNDFLSGKTIKEIAGRN